MAIQEGSKVTPHTKEYSGGVSPIATPLIDTETEFLLIDTETGAILIDSQGEG